MQGPRFDGSTLNMGKCSLILEVRGYIIFENGKGMFATWKSWSVSPPFPEEEVVLCTSGPSFGG